MQSCPGLRATGLAHFLGSSPKANDRIPSTVQSTHQAIPWGKQMGRSDSERPTSGTPGSEHPGSRVSSASPKTQSVVWTCVTATCQGKPASEPCCEPVAVGRMAGASRKQACFFGAWTDSLTLLWRRATWASHLGRQVTAHCDTEQHWWVFCLSPMPTRRGGMTTQDVKSNKQRRPVPYVVGHCPIVLYRGHL